MKERHYCQQCGDDTPHTTEVERDACYPPQDFIEAEAEGTASAADCIFYANGDSEWRVTCTVCGSSCIEG